MKKFVTQISIFGLIVTAMLIMGLFITRITYPQNLHYALIDKHKLLEETDGPRIVLMGGSNVGFGVNSQILKNELEINVINTTISAGLGLKYIVEDMIPYLKERDIVILIPEYNHFFGNTLWGTEPMVSSAIAVPKNIRLINFKNWKQILGSLPKRSVENILKFFISLMRRALNIENKGVYSRTSFNKQGDVVAHYGKPPVPFKNQTAIPGAFNEETIFVIKRLQHAVESKNGKFFISFSCLNNSSFENVTDKIDRVERRCKKEKFKLLGTPQRYSLDDNLYYNTNLHLTEPGVELRTRLLIEDIREAGIVRNQEKTRGRR